MGKRRGFLLLAFAALATLAGACMWDSDTLAEEAKGKMDLVGTIVGRFDRNPPLYYEMRIERVTKEVASHPSDLNLYDDLGVAEERLGHHDKAIAWMAKKKAAMKPLDMKSKASKDAWYRYHANIGTFYAHRAIETPLYRKEDFGDARNHIRAALKINPHAHFGREMVQLDILDWMAKFETLRFEGSLSEYLREVHEHMPDRDAKIAEGLAGLIRLGSAWQSVDVFAALRDELSWKKDGNLASLADFRVKELLKAGKKSYAGDVDTGPAVWRPTATDAKFNETEYKRLREEAELYRKNRAEYMQVRLQEGKHPDTDPRFWDDFHEGAAPEVRSPGFFGMPNTRIWGSITIALTLICLVPTLVAIFAIRWFLKRRRVNRGL